MSDDLSTTREHGTPCASAMCPDMVRSGVCKKKWCIVHGRWEEPLCDLLLAVRDMRKKWIEAEEELERTRKRAENTKKLAISLFQMLSDGGL